MARSNYCRILLLIKQSVRFKCAEIQAARKKGQKYGSENYVAAQSAAD